MVFLKLFHVAYLKYEKISWEDRHLWVMLHGFWQRGGKNLRNLMKNSQYSRHQRLRGQKLKVHSCLRIPLSPWKALNKTIKKNTLIKFTSQTNKNTPKASTNNSYHKSQLKFAKLDIHLTWTRQKLHFIWKISCSCLSSFYFSWLLNVIWKT